MPDYLPPPADAKAGTIHYSLFEAAKMHELEPYAYVNAVFKALPYADTVEKNRGSPALEF